MTYSGTVTWFVLCDLQLQDITPAEILHFTLRDIEVPFNKYHVSIINVSHEIGKG